MEQRLNTYLHDSFGHDLNTASEKEIYEALLTLTKEEMQGRPRIAGKKKLYYI